MVNFLEGKLSCQNFSTGYFVGECTVVHLVGVLDPFPMEGGETSYFKDFNLKYKAMIWH